MDRLAAVLWAEDEIDNPANALKNLVYRLRGLLKDSLHLDGTEFILHKHGTYVWNQDIPCIIDVDLLEAEYDSARQQGLSKEKCRQHYLNIIKIYKGNFLPHASYKEWVAPLTVYYQRIYMGAIARLCDIFFEEEDYAHIEEVCLQGISIDPFVEENHIFLIKALISTNRHENALQHYNHISKLFYNELGVKPSDSLTSLYQEILNKTGAINRDISIIKKDLKEIQSIKGAVYCNYEMFKTLYRLEARAALRTGKSIFLVLLTVTGPQQKELPAKNIDETFEKLKTVILSTLRKDDIVTRFGRTQFLLMLSNLSYENSTMVLNKVIKKINESGVKKYIEVYGQVQSLDLIELEGTDV